MVTPSSPDEPLWADNCSVSSSFDNNSAGAVAIEHRSGRQIGLLHNEGAESHGHEELSTLPRPDPHQIPQQPAVEPRQQSTFDTQDDMPEHIPSPRFVGDLNPEARLLDETTSPEETPDTATGEVGVWLRPQLSGRRSINADHTSPVARSPPTQKPHLTYPRPPLSDVVPESSIRALSDLYFAKVHPIIPILNEEEYRHSMSQYSIPMPLIHVVCLIVAKDSDAGQHLKLLQSGNSVLPVRQFCSHLHTSLVTALSRPRFIKKMTLLRILALLSLHHEGNDGADEASSCVAQAVHHALSMAFHLQRPKDDNFDVKRTFWCLWTLDRLNAAIHSRPCCMSDMDIAIDYIAPEETGSVAFDVWFRIAKLLNKVIGLYRPAKDKSPISGLDSDFPMFEQIIDEMKAWKLPPSMIGLSCPQSSHSDISKGEDGSAWLTSRCCHSYSSDVLSFNGNAISST